MGTNHSVVKTTHVSPDGRKRTCSSSRAALGTCPLAKLVSTTREVSTFTTCRPRESHWKLGAKANAPGKDIRYQTGRKQHLSCFVDKLTHARERLELLALGVVLVPHRRRRDAEAGAGGGRGWHGGEGLRRSQGGAGGGYGERRMREM
jgi:hypothetical protein